jgi:hypothetical protein
VSEHSPRHRRRDPAWLYYVVAFAVLAVLAALDQAGLFDRLGP